MISSIKIRKYEFWKICLKDGQDEAVKRIIRPNNLDNIIDLQ